MKIKGKCNWTTECSVDMNTFSEIELTPQELAEQLTNEEWDEIKLLKWQHEKPKPDKIEELDLPKLTKNYFKKKDGDITCLYSGIMFIENKLNEVIKFINNPKGE